MSFKRLLLPAVFYLLLCSLTLALLIFLMTRTPSLRSGEPLPADLTERNYAIVLPDYQKEEGCFVFTYPISGRDLPPLSIAITDVGAFHFQLEGEDIYSLMAWDKSEHMRTISLGSQPDKNGDGVLEFSLFMRPSERWKAILIGSSESITRMAQRSAGLNAFIIGMLPIMILYALSLFYFKRSETYLLTFFVTAAISFVLVLIEYNTLSLPLPIWLYNILRYPCIFFPTILTSALCRNLTEASLGPLDPLFQPGAMLIHLVILTMLRVLYLPVIYHIALLVTYLLGMCVLIRSCAERHPFSWLLLTAYALRQAIRYSATLCTAGVLVPGELRIYFCSSPASDVVFLISCMLLINHRFAYKFRESEALTQKLSEINATLDAKVLSRTQQLSEANENLHREQEQRHQMMINIFHDLRGPLFVIQGNLDILATREPEICSPYLTLVQKKVSFLQQLIADLFLVAKLEGNHLTLLQEPLDLSTVLLDLQRENLESARQKSIALTLRSEGPGWVLGDPFRMEQIIQNLLDNAFLYTQPGGTVTLSLSTTPQEVKISVEDTGEGIAPEDLPHIFERYYHSSAVRRPHSTGLGLAIVRELTRAQGGEVSAESCPGYGSCFLLRFPRYIAPNPGPEDTNAH